MTTANAYSDLPLTTAVVYSQYVSFGELDSSCDCRASICVFVMSHHNLVHTLG